jgi:hypothetical protein
MNYESSPTLEALAAPTPVAPERQRKNRASNAEKVLAMITSRFNDRDFQKRVKLARLVEDAFDRIPPDSEADLDADGLGWCANVDWGGMAAGISDGVETDYNLATQPETYVRMIGASQQGRVVEPMRILEQLDKEMLDDWSEWLPELEMMIHNRRALGLGVFHFSKPNSWHFKSLHPCNLILPKRAKLNPETWAWCALKTEFEITDLLARLGDKEVSAKSGWKVAGVEKAIEEFAQNGGRELIASINNDPEGFIYDLSSDDLHFGHENGVSIEGWIFYVKEWDGSVSEHLLVNKADIGFIYSGIGRHKRMGDIIALFPLSLGQGHIERIRGYGLQMLPFHDLENQVMNHAVDVTTIASGLILNGGSGDDYKRLREEVFINGPIMTLPEGMTMAQQSFGNPTPGLLGLRREFERMGNFRNRAFGGAETGSRNQEESATAARLRWQDANSVRTYEIARFYKQLGTFHSIRVMRYLRGGMTEADPGGAELKVMITEAGLQGVTSEDVAGIRRVVARTIFGDGDPNNQFLALMDLKEFFPKLPPSGQRLFMRMAFIARLRDVDLVNEAMGPETGGQDRELSFQRWHAAVENDVFEGSDTRVDPMETDNHLIHAGEHTVYVEEVVARLDRGEITEDVALPRILRADAHTSPHLAALAADPFAQFEAKDMMRRWADVRNRARQIAQILERKQEEERNRQMEELRNPQPNVKDRETILTEQVKRAAELEKKRMEMEHEKELHQLRISLAKSGALTKAQSDILKQAPGS